MKNTSWEQANKWYEELVSNEGHYYHKTLILPAILQKIKDLQIKSVLDIACGQGVLARALPKNLRYMGFDLSKSLIKAAIERNRNPNHTFLHGDARSFVATAPFDCATCVLAVQDIDRIDELFVNAAKSLNPGGRLIIVMNHPCFRIPRQSRWTIDQKNQVQSRTVDKYLSQLDIPIQTNPGQGKSSPVVVHHHRPLSFYIQALRKAGFVIENFEEWISDKTSTGGCAKMENRARKEFPLFACITALLR